MPPGSPNPHPISDQNMQFSNTHLQALPLNSRGCCDVVRGDRGNSALMRSLRVQQSKTAHIILDLPPLSSAFEALELLKWKPLFACRVQHHAMFTYKCLDNLTHYDYHLVSTSNGAFHAYIYVQYRSKESYHPLARRESRRALRESCRALRDSRSARREALKTVSFVA